MIKSILLRLNFLWVLEMEWDWSNEMDYIRSPRQFWRHKIFKKYHISHIFREKSLSKKEIIKVFIHEFKCKNLIDGEFCIATHETYNDIINYNYKKKIQ